MENRYNVLVQSDAFRLGGESLPNILRCFRRCNIDIEEIAKSRYL